MGFFLTLAIATILHGFLWIYLFVKRERGVLMPAGFLNWRTYVFGLFVLYFITSMTWCGVWLGSFWSAEKQGVGLAESCSFLSSSATMVYGRTSRDDHD